MRGTLVYMVRTGCAGGGLFGAWGLVLLLLDAHHALALCPLSRRRQQHEQAALSARRMRSGAPYSSGTVAFILTVSSAVAGHRPLGRPSTVRGCSRYWSGDGELQSLRLLCRQR